MRARTLLATALCILASAATANEPAHIDLTKEPVRILLASGANEITLRTNAPIRLGRETVHGREPGGPTYRAARQVPRAAAPAFQRRPSLSL